MVVELTTENILLIGSVMLIFSIMIVKAGFRFGVPSLLVFLAAECLWALTDWEFRFRTIPRRSSSA